MARLLLLTVVLIVYGSLYPWHFRLTSDDPFWILEYSVRRSFDPDLVKDVAVNVLVYLPLGLFALSACAERWRASAAFAASIFLGFVLSLAIEIVQVYVPGRVPSLFDVAANTVGTALGAAAGLIWRRTLHRPLRRPDAEILLCCWAAYQCFPFLPRLTRVGRVAPSSAAGIFLDLAQTAALASLVAAIGHDLRWRRLMLAGLLLLVPAKLLIFTRTVETGEIIAAAAVFVAALAMPFPPRIVAALLAAALLVHGLVPFHFEGPPNPFWWTPFQGSLFSDWEYALTVLLGKVFAYSALVWLLREAGVRLLAATAAAAVLLASIEAAQIYLPSRTSEITDPIIAVLAGWVFWSLQPDLKRAGNALSGCSDP